MVSKAALIRRSISLQYGAVILGLAWGWLAFRDHQIWESWLTYWLAPGAISVVLLALPSFGLNRGNAGGLAAALACYAPLIMRIEPFVEVYDGVSLLWGVGAILPPLLCIKILVRSRAWPAVWGVVLFAATSIACLTFNALADTHGLVSGFFAAYRYRWCR
jgi:hypothetical protein